MIRPPWLRSIMCFATNLVTGTPSKLTLRTRAKSSVSMLMTRMLGKTPASLLDSALPRWPRHRCLAQASLAMARPRRDGNRPALIVDGDRLIGLGLDAWIALELGSIPEGSVIEGLYGALAAGLSSDPRADRCDTTWRCDSGRVYVTTPTQPATRARRVAQTPHRQEDPRRVSSHYAAVVAQQVLILGAGFGGLELATRLSDSLRDEVQITLVDQNDSFIFGFSKLDILFGRRTRTSSAAPTGTSPNLAWPTARNG